MKIQDVDSPDINDSSAKEKTGKSLEQWFAELDALGGLERGRRELINRLSEVLSKDAWWATTLVVEYERARGQKEKDGKPTGYSICSTKTVGAPIEKVFGAFGDAKVLDQWLGSKTKLDFKDGGGLHNGAGDSATIVRIRPNKDLRLAWNGTLGAGSAVEVLFADKGKGKTGITLNHTRIQSRAEADQLRAGWSAALESLRTVLEKA